MREIKFRGQDIDTKEWIYGDYCYNPVMREHKIITYLEDKLLGMAQAMYGDKQIKPRRTMRVHIVIPESVGQFIEYRDVNDKEVYDGDYVKYEYPCATGRLRVGEVKWNAILHQFVIKDLKTGKIHVKGDIHTCEQIREVIGDKFNNPELLKEGD